MEISLNTWSVTGIHISLSLLLLLTLNWIGRHSASSGYIALSVFLRRDTAPAFNFIFRTIGPTIFITIASLILYSVNLDQVVREIWLVVPYYFIFRLILIAFMSRQLLVNWTRETITCSAAILVAIAGHALIIQYPDRLTPDPSDLKNQFWVLVILFLYTTANKIEFNADASITRKRRYLARTYEESRARYEKIIDTTAEDALSRSIIYAILIFEQFNRPRAVRTIERITFPWLSKTIGPMQTTTAKRLTDAESVEAGASRVMEEYRSSFKIGTEKAKDKEIEFNPFLNENHRKFLLHRIAAEYNRDDSYVNGIIEIHEELVMCVFEDLKIPNDLPHWTEYLI
jgi:hypothetical protein